VHVINFIYTRVMYTKLAERTQNFAFPLYCWPWGHWGIRQI